MLHGILHPAATAGIATGIHPEAARRLERLLAGDTLLGDVHAAPGAPGKFLRNCPPTLVTLGARKPPGIAPPVGPATIGAEIPIPLHPVATDAAYFAGPGCGPPAPTPAHTGRRPRLRCAE